VRGTLRAGLVAGLLAAAACSHGQPDIATLTSNSDQVIWEAGQKALEKHDWESARQHFKRIIDAFPQSQYAPPARIALGDAYVREGGTAGDILAIGAYREFLTLYPSHPRSDYAQFQVAESYFRQKSGPDRDQTQTLHALEEYERLLELYPGSQYIENARGRIKELRQNLARAEFMAGYFYQRTRQYCRAALARYEGILKDFPEGFPGLRRSRPRSPSHGRMPPRPGTHRGGAPAPEPPARGVSGERGGGHRPGPDGGVVPAGSRPPGPPCFRPRVGRGSSRPPLPCPVSAR
jgi:outer membrane assembly lipoprotein YfiO